MKLFFWMAIFAIGHGIAAAQTPPHHIQHKIIFQISTSDTLAWKGLMNNLKNLKEGWGDSVLVEVVAHGPGILLLTKDKSTQMDAIKTHVQKGIVFYACENTMREKKINKEEIVAEAAFVTMGIGHVVKRQEEKWSYIKAGF